jgi:competence ComEA-like helix-hairpin-helix protein
MLRGLDVNRATPEEMVKRFDRVGLSLAKTIVQNREVFGPYLSIHDLGRVPGVGPAAFMRITGLPWREDAAAKREKVMAIVGPTADGEISLQEMAARFAAAEEFEGCLIVDADGDLLSTSWNAENNEAIGAMAPIFIDKLSPYIQSLGAGTIDAVSIFIGERAFTLIPCETLVFVAVHRMNKFSRRQLRVAQQVAAMLGQLLFKRATPA